MEEPSPDPNPTPTMPKRYPLRSTPARSNPPRPITPSPPDRPSAAAAPTMPKRYPLRSTPARTNPPRPITPSPPDRLSAAAAAAAANTAAAEEGKSAEQLPRRYPSRVRVSAVQNSPPTKEPPSKKRARGGDGEKQGLEDDADSRKRAKHIIDEFRKLYRSLAAEHDLKEDKQQKKKPGERTRFDLDAYTLMKEKNNYLTDVTHRIGSIAGVEVGDEFNFRTELFLVGLHCQMQADIDYVRRDDDAGGGRTVATSVACKSVAKSGLLVCCGSGAKSKDQKMDRGNLAMKNSMEAKTPVRVVHSFKVGKGVNTYVYGGLYSVERYWKKKGNHGRDVFVFEMRRLSGQPELNAERLEELAGSRPRSKEKTPAGDEHVSTSESTSEVIHPTEDGTKGTEVPSEKKGVILEAAPLAYEFVPCSDKGPHCKKIRETLHEFQEIYDKLAIEEASKKESEVPKRKKGVGEGLRFDLAAFNLFKERNKDLSYTSRCLGNLPGVDVGDKFNFRVQLFLIGLHRMLQADIDYIRQGEKMVAVSIVSMHSEQYNDKVCKSNILLCRGGGGMHNRDQKMEGGNLAMKNSIVAKTPVRVIHCFKSSKKATLYIFGGLYLVEKYWRRKDAKGRYIFMFQLRRLPGQPKLDLNIEEIKKTISSRSRSPCDHTEDISAGKEKVPIKVVNTINDEKPLPFVYITKVIHPPNYSPPPSEGCNCVNGCSDSDECACAVKNGGEIPFNRKGLIVEAKPLVYECGPSCKCPPTCHNRVSQHGITFPLEVFKTESMGWGLRSRSFIPSGSFICEYVGELLEDEEATKRTTDEYLFAIGNNYHDESLWEGLSTSIPSLQKGAQSEDMEDGGFTLDACNFGNVGRFINHHCTPNLYAQNVLFDHDDKRMPHIMLFASEDIPPLQELTYHYNYTIDGVHDSDGNIKVKNCYCGSIECTGRLY